MIIRIPAGHQPRAPIAEHIHQQFHFHCCSIFGHRSSAPAQFFYKKIFFLKKLFLKKNWKKTVSFSLLLHFWAQKFCACTVFLQKNIFSQKTVLKKNWKKTVSFSLLLHFWAQKFCACTVFFQKNIFSQKTVFKKKWKKTVFPSQFSSSIADHT